MIHKTRTKYGKRRTDRLKCIVSLLLIGTMIMPAIAASRDAGFSAAYAAEDDNGLSSHVIDTVSPNHVTFNLFDYWLKDRETSYYPNVKEDDGMNKGHSFLFGCVSGSGPWNVWTGNATHFNAQSNNTGIRYGVYEGIVSDELQNGYPVLSLNDDYQDPKRHPAFVENKNLVPTLTESLAYLFDPDVESDYKAVYENVQGLVKYDNNGGYIYNSHENFASFIPAKDGIGTNGQPSDGSFQVYDNWALPSAGSPSGQFFPFDGADEVFVRENGKYSVGNDGKLVPKNNVPLENGTTLNHYMGLTMETVFLQPSDGKIDQDTPMIFSFSGDDDVWIYIDNVLVSDLGGIHDECFTIIDFETGSVYTGLTPMIQNADKTFTDAVPSLDELRAAENGKPKAVWSWYDRAKKVSTNGNYETFKAAHDIKKTTLREIFTNAGLEDTQVWGASGMSEDTFDQNTQHELKMFYLERGAGASNLVLEFNMLAVPASGITKTDQDGRPVSGAEFTLWPAQLSGEVDQKGRRLPLTDEKTGLYLADKSQAPICKATTDENGHLNFITENRKIISFQERAQDKNNPQFYYVLEETGRPCGYRSKGDISLYYSVYKEESNEGVLLSHDYWQTGAYTQAMLDVTMTSELYEYEIGNDGKATVGEQIGSGEEDIDEYLDNGIIFAIPIKRMDMDGSMYDETNFHAVYGTMTSGWTMMTEDITDKKSVLEAAKGMAEAMRQNRQSGTIIAERNARQLFHVTMSNIPGDVKLSYPYLMNSGNVNASQYNIAFYFAPNAQTLDEVDPDQIVRIATQTKDGDSFERQYASQFYIANTLNRLRVQKLDYRGNRIEGATFNMYQTYSAFAREGYELVGEDSADTAHIGMYRNSNIVNGDGTLKSREHILESTVWDSGTTLSEGSAAAGGLDLDGAIIFPTEFDRYVYGDQRNDYKTNPQDTSTFIEEGEYVIYEAGVPDGYTINQTPINVIVNDEGVFADAGEVNDGIRVGQYAGWILNSMSQFAAESAVDETLTFVSTTLKVRSDDGLVSPVEGENTWLNKYSNENHRYIFFAEDMGYYVTTGRNLYQFTDEGTPQLIVRQDNSLTAKVLILDGDFDDHSGLVTINKRNNDGSIYTLQGVATQGTLAFWLRNKEAVEGQQTLDSVWIEDQELKEGRDYHVYTPSVTDLSQYADLSGLFSTETLVQVYNQNVGDLEISKSTSDVAENSEDDEEIFYYRVYDVYERATKIVLAQDSNNDGHADLDDGQPKLNSTFNGTLNVRLHEEIEGVEGQAAATNVAVDFVNGVGLLYLEPEYDVEYVYIPENKEHDAYGYVGLVESQITLDSGSEEALYSGEGIINLEHLITFKGDDHTHTLTIDFEDGKGIFYLNPEYEVASVQAGGTTYTPGAETNSASITQRFQFATIQQILNMETTAEVDVRFTEEDGKPSSPERIITQSQDGPGKNVTVDSDGNDGYKMTYSLESNTHTQAVVAQFALHSGQTIHISGLGGGTTYYIYEYAADDKGQASPQILNDKWQTQITITPQGAQNGTRPITDNYETVIQNYLPEYRAAMGIIRTNSTQKVDFTNKARVGNLTVSKTVEGDQATDTDRNKDFTFILTMKSADGTPLRGSYPYEGTGNSGVTQPADGSLTLDENGTAEFTLRHGQSITINNIPKDAFYEVIESGNEGYTTTVEGDSDGDGDADGQIREGECSVASFTNLKLSTLSFTKVDAQDYSASLSGAEFDLYVLNCSNPDHDHSAEIVTDAGDCWKHKEKATSKEDGTVSFGSLTANTQYRLTETKAPDGYALPEGQWKISTDENNMISIEAVGGQDGRMPTAFATGDGGRLLLPNVKPIDIPSSGGTGPWMFILAGGLLMMAAVVLYTVKRSHHKNAASK